MPITEEQFQKFMDSINAKFDSINKQFELLVPKEDTGDDEPEESAEITQAKADYKELLESKMDEKDLEKLDTLPKLQIAFAITKNIKLDQSDYNPAPPEKGSNAKTDSRNPWEIPEVN